MSVKMLVLSPGEKPKVDVVETTMAELSRILGGRVCWRNVMPGTMILYNERAESNTETLKLFGKSYYGTIAVCETANERYKDIKDDNSILRMIFRRAAE